MKKYIKLIPIVLYPYAYLIALAVIFASANSEGIMGQIAGAYNDPEAIADGISPKLFYYASIAIVILYNVMTVVFAVQNAVYGAKGKYTAHQTAKMNLIVKCCQIPAYIFHFLIGAAGLVMSIWGLGFFLVAVIVDFLTIILTGINALGCPIRLYREGRLTKVAATVLCISSFVYCVDIVIAIYLMVISRKKTDVKVV